jgi:hypothetical protein
MIPNSFTERGALVFTQKAAPAASAVPADSAESTPWVTATVAAVRARGRDDRGDVPGWVLITLMTAGLVVIIWALAAPALSGVFEQAIDRVVGF